MWKKIKKAAKKVWRTVKKVVRVLKEIGMRGFGILDFLGSLLGVMPRKRLIARFVVLMDEKRNPVQFLPEVERWVAVTKQVFNDRLNVEVKPWHDKFVSFVPTPSPAALLRPADCSFTAGFGDAADDFEDLAGDLYYSEGSSLGEELRRITGYGEPIVIIVVEATSAGVRGCAYPWIHNFCWVISKPLSTTPSHEAGHLCGLFPHSSAAHNLMNSDRLDMDSNMNRLQVSWARNSRYITFL